MTNTMEIYDQGLNVLVENLGVVKAEQFISIVKRESFDYTKWQQEYFDRMPRGAFMEKAAEYGREYEYNGEGKVI